MNGMDEARTVRGPTSSFLRSPSDGDQTDRVIGDSGYPQTSRSNSSL